jgi:uncharacterized membrane protein
MLKRSMDRTGHSAAHDRSHLGGFLRRRFGELSGVGLALGTLLFAASLTPSLVPRTALTQGALAGACFAAGYGIGVFWRWLWHYLEIPTPSERILRLTNIALAVFCLSVATVFAWKAAEWQNTIRAVMDMPPLESSHPFRIGLIALLTFGIILAIATLFKLFVQKLSAWMHRYIPRRVANVLGVVVVALLFWTFASDVVFRTVFTIADSSFREVDARLEPERPQPSNPMKTGSAASLVDWKELGRAGREFVAAAPTAQEIAAETNRPALDPVRVYVGLGAAETAQGRAALALREMQRVGAFERKALVVVTPTGTGWIDPAAMDAVEFLHHGDIASVALQYSYLSSPLSLILQPEYGREAARAIFEVVYDYWRSLPKETRPKLYLHGLSLGAMNSERSLELFEIIGDPIDGAMWSGPPFETRMWRQMTNGRNAGSPAWLPEFRDGSFARFMNQNGPTVPADTPWGPTRIVYLQYASDAVTFFDYRDLFRQPAWMDEPRGPDVSSKLGWYPVVTMLQIAVDMAVATTTPMGHGHVYAPQHYVEAWTAVANITDFSPGELEALKPALARRAGMLEDIEQNRGG